MRIFEETKKLVAKEKYYTFQILKNLMIIERDKLFSDLRYDSLHTYLRRELKYTDAEATLRVNAVRLMLKSPTSIKYLESGKLSISNAARANQAIQMSKTKDKNKINDLIDFAASTSTRKLNQYLAENFGAIRRETVILDDRILRKFDQLRNRLKLNDESTYEVIQIILEIQLRAQTEKSKLKAQLRKRKGASKNSRYIPKAIKAEVKSTDCANCGKQWDLEFDHIQKFSHGGLNDASNIQMLFRNCKQRKEIK